VHVNDTRTLDDLLGGELTRCPTGEARIVHHCLEAQTAIQKGVSTALKNIPFNRAELRREVYDAVCESLVRYLGSPELTNEKFLRSPNRLGWLYLFTVRTAKGWIRARLKERDGDERVTTALRDRHLPAETLTQHQERERQTAENLSTRFDPYQFAGKRRAPPADRFAGEFGEFGERESIEHFSSDDADAELVTAIRQVLESLSEDDREFFEGYIDAKYERGKKHTPADRKRFSRLRQRIREEVTNGEERAA
jgi:hypothetical protein